jgi:hypothetical protein
MLKEKSDFAFYNDYLQSEPLMRNRKTQASQSGFTLVQVSELDENGDEIRTSYEVVEPDGNVAGLFGSLREAEGFYKLLCHLDQDKAV